MIESSPWIADFTDTGDYWMFPYESPTFRFDVEDAWEEIKPLYVQLHTYVRRKLRDHYGPEKIHRRAPIPAHILGDFLLPGSKLNCYCRSADI